MDVLEQVRRECGNNVGDFPMSDTLDAWNEELTKLSYDINCRGYMGSSEEELGKKFERDEDGQLQVKDQLCPGNRNILLLVTFFKKKKKK